jgi:hypothetical protein
VIGPGWLPGYRPRLGQGRKRTLAYTRTTSRKRRRSPRALKKQDVAPRAMNTEIVLFDHGPAEFPVATAVPREPRARLIATLADLKRWVAARWDWFKPRTVPCAVAGLGMVAVIASAHYLAHQHDDDAAQIRAPRVVHISVTTR